MQWPEGLREWQGHAQHYARDALLARNTAAETHDDPRLASLLDELGELGFQQLCADTRLGGLGEDVDTLAAVLEPIAAVDATAASVIYASAAAQLTLRACSRDTPVAESADGPGNAWVASLTFHDAAQATLPRYSRKRLQGKAPMVMPGALARQAILPAHSGDSGSSVVWVQLEGPGVDVGRPVRTLGLNGAGISDLVFDGANCVCLSGDGDAVLRAVRPRLAVAATAMLCGVMRGSLETARDYAAERHQGGGNLLGWGEVRRILAGMEQALSVSQALLFRMVCEPEDGGRFPEQAFAHVTTMARELTCNGVQLLGGNGYMKDFGQEKRMRDARQLGALLGNQGIVDLVQ